MLVPLLGNVIGPRRGGAAIRGPTVCVASGSVYDSALPIPKFLSTPRADPAFFPPCLEDEQASHVADTEFRDRLFC
jgi:hypothetical protein